MFDPDNVEGRAAIDAHAAKCHFCRQRISVLAAFADALRCPETWHALDGLPRQSANPATTDFVSRLEAEESEAEQLLRPLLNASSGRFVWVDISKQRKYCTGGAVRLLCSEAHDSCERKPRRALSLADAAMAIAESLPDNLYPNRAIHDLRGVAWKERANANRYLGNLQEALRDLACAEEAFMKGPAPAIGVGIVKYIRASVLHDRDELDEALAEVRASARIFQGLGLTSRYMSARNVEGMVLYEARRFTDARAVFAEIVTFGRTSGDRSWIARAALNLANCDIELADYAQAGTGLQCAREVFEQLGLTTELVRVDWSEGLLLLATGRRIEGVRCLDDVGRALADAGMVLDSALVKLTALEARLPDDRSDEIMKIAEGLVEMFVSTGRITGALAALAHINELAAARRLNPAVLTHVKSFLSRSKRRPELVFVPSE